MEKTAAKLALTFVRRKQTVVASQLPLSFGTPDEVSKRRMDGAMGYIHAVVPKACGVGKGLNVSKTGQLIANDKQIADAPARLLKNTYHSRLSAFVPLGNHLHAQLSLSVCLSNAYRGIDQHFVQLANSLHPRISRSVHYVSDNRAVLSAIKHFRTDNQLRLSPSVIIESLKRFSVSGALIGREQGFYTSEAVAVPCRFYPLPEPPPPPPEPPRLCKLRPPASRLPLTFRRKTKTAASRLPLSFRCWHDTEDIRIIPKLKAYIVKNTITATVGGITVAPIDFDIQTEMGSYCWSGNLSIGQSCYHKIKDKLQAPRGQEPLIKVCVNDKTFVIIAEQQSRSRQFIGNRYKLGGRSITARLDADYAKSQGGLINQDSFASQIINQQLNGLLVSLDKMTVPDWLIPANQYAVTDKTPLAVIGDIAAACGGFVTSHPSQPILSLLPRWKTPAWQLPTAKPDVTVIADVIREIADKKRIKPRYNTVTLVSGTEAAVVYRQQQSRDDSAPVMDNPLYTAKAAQMAAGAAILSDSGIHGDYTLTMRWADKYHIPLAEVGQIWQVGDPEGAWRGVITAVAVNVTQENRAPTIWQTLTLDRYLDE